MSRQHQIRLMLMIVALGCVLAGSRIVGRAQFWAGLFPNSQAAEPTQTTTVHTTRRPQFTTNQDASVVPILREDFRQDIQDDVLGVKSSETKAWLMSMGLAQRIRAAEAKQLPYASYALLMDAPEDCRGKAWTITGTLRRMTRETVTNRSILTNESVQYENIVDAWLTLSDSGDSLVHVVALEAARDLPFGTSYGEDAPEVTVSGYYFKREAYASGAEGGLSIAPLLLAGRISRVPPPAITTARSERLTTWLSWLTVITCGVLFLVAWSFVSSDALHRRQRTHELTQLPKSPSFEGVDAESPYDTLQQLEATVSATPGSFQRN